MATAAVPYRTRYLGEQSAAGEHDFSCHADDRIHAEDCECWCHGAAAAGFSECSLLADREPALVVPLTRGHEAFISPGKAELVAAYKWSAQRRDNGLWYAIAYVVGSARGGKPSRYVYMHALVSGGQRVDHRDRNGLNNTDANLRAATTVQNGGNTGKRSGTSSRYKGVTYVARTGRWAAQLHHLGRKTHLGYHATEEEAARVYDDAAVRHFGEFACTNVMLGLLPAGEDGG